MSAQFFQFHMHFFIFCLCFSLLFLHLVDQIKLIFLCRSLNCKFLCQFYFEFTFLLPDYLLRRSQLSLIICLWAYTIFWFLSGLLLLRFFLLLIFFFFLRLSLLASRSLHLYLFPVFELVSWSLFHRSCWFFRPVKIRLFDIWCLILHRTGLWELLHSFHELFAGRRGQRRTSSDLIQLDFLSWSSFLFILSSQLSST